MAEMMFGGELDEELGRRPTRAEIRTAIRAAIAVSEEGISLVSPEDTPSDRMRMTVSVGDITKWVHHGSQQDRETSIRHWRDRRIKKWRELMSSGDEDPL